MKYILAFLGVIFYNIAGAQVSGLLFHNLQQLNAAYMGEEDDLNFKAGAYSGFYKSEPLIPNYYSSVNTHLGAINSNAGIMLSGNFYNYSDWSEANTSAALNYNYKLRLSKKHYLKLGASVNYHYNKFEWTYPEYGYQVNHRLNAEPSIWFAGDSSGFSFGVSANNLIGENYNAYHWTQGPHVFYILRYEAGRKRNLQVSPAIMLFHNYKPYEWDDLNFQVEGVFIGADLTYKKKFHAGISGIFLYSLTANAGYTLNNNLRLVLSFPIKDPDEVHGIIEAMLAWRL